MAFSSTASRPFVPFSSRSREPDFDALSTAAFLVELLDLDLDLDRYLAEGGDLDRLVDRDRDRLERLLDDL